MTKVESQPESLLLPLASLALLAGGGEGAEFLRQFGWEPGDFESGLADMVQRVEASGGPQASAQVELSRRLAGVSRAVTGWLSVTSLTGVMVPRYVFRSGAECMVLRVHGPIAEWRLATSREAAALLNAAIDDAPTDLLISVWRQGQVRASALIALGLANLAARNQAPLDRLRRAAAGGLPELLLALLAELSPEDVCDEVKSALGGVRG